METGQEGDRTGRRERERERESALNDLVSLIF